MMGPSHALSGAAAWLAGSVALDHFAGYHQSPAAVVAGAVVCAGGALLPDLDMSGKVTANKGGATIAHTFGVASLFVAEVVEKLSLGVYHLTKGRRDPDRDNGHRTLTHTLPFTVLVGWGTTALCANFGRWAVLGVLFFMFALALRGLFNRWAERAGWLVITGVAAVGAVAAFVSLPDGRGYPLLGAAVGVGALVHILGDWITMAGVPILWPIPINGRMWKMFGLCDPFAIKAGGGFERWALRSLFVVASVLSLAAIAWPPIVGTVQQLIA